MIATINQTFTAEAPLVGAKVEVNDYARPDAEGYRKARILSDSEYVRNNTDGYVMVKLSHLTQVMSPSTDDDMDERTVTDLS